GPAAAHRGGPAVAALGRLLGPAAGLRVRPGRRDAARPAPAAALHRLAAAQLRRPRRRLAPGGAAVRPDRRDAALVPPRPGGSPGGQLRAVGAAAPHRHRLPAAPAAVAYSPCPPHPPCPPP